MPRLTDTYALAYQACDQVLTETAKFPTIDRIRERIGVNSPATIKRAIHDWTVAFAEKHLDTLHRPEIPVALVDACDQLWRLAVKQAEQALTRERENLAQERQDWARQAADTEATIQRLQATVQQLQTTIASQQTALAGLQSERVEQDAQSAATEQALTTLQAAHTQLEQQLTRERQRAETQQRDTEAWYQRRIVEERELAANKAQNELRHLQGLNAVLESARQQGAQQLQHWHGQCQELKAQVQQLEQQVAARATWVQPPAKKAATPKTAPKPAATRHKKAAPRGGGGQGAG